ncbi:TolC family protein [Telmatobacter sp. DSM 110680]|uniref:TolC family protein n=1 Tax=Telmatobacter sp. DSM 110680 TaxID=3036704 RepID=A0AAU7DRG8_9BACT
MNLRGHAVSTRWFLRIAAVGALAGMFAGQSLHAQTNLSWDAIKAEFESENPTLKADALNVDEMKAEEITAFLRPNPGFTLSSDGTQLVPHNGVWQPFTGTQVQTNFSYLHERDHKRELRLQSSKEGTQISRSLHADLERNLLFNLRVAFVDVLQAKAILGLTKQELDYYDRIIEISRERNRTGAMAQIDLDRVELQRVQYESDWQTAEVSLRTAKIQLLQLLDDRTPVDQFDVQGPFEFSDVLKPLEDFRQIAMDNRPDLKAAVESIQQAKTNYKLAVANGSTDPTFSGWYTYNPSFNNPNDQQTLGVSISVPLRIFDRNQGEKKRTLLDIDRNQKLEDAAHAQVFSDVDSAYAQVNSNIILLRPYKDKYLEQALRVRETVTYSWQRGAASLMDFLNAQSDYRQVQLAYVQLIGSYLTAAGQLNLAVGIEEIH